MITSPTKGCKLRLSNLINNQITTYQHIKMLNHSNLV